MKALLKITAILFVSAMFCAWYQHPLSFGNSEKATHNYPPDFPQITHPIDSRFSADSVLADSLYQVLWKNYGNQHWDSMILNGKALEVLGKHLLEQKFNKRIFTYWGHGYGSVGQALLYLGEIEAGSQLLNEGMEIRERVMGDSAFMPIATTYFGAGFMAMNLFDDPELALQFMKRGEYIYRKCLPDGDKRQYVAFNMLGHGYWRCGDYAAGLSYYNKARALEGMEPFDVHCCYFELSKRYLEINDLAHALHYSLLAKAQLSTPVPASLFNEIELCKIYLLLGDIEKSAKQIVYCTQFYDKQKDSFKAKGVDAEINRVKGDYYFLLKNYPLAIEYKKASIAILENSGAGKSSNSTIERLQDLAKTFLAINMYPEAREIINELLYRETKQVPNSCFELNPALSTINRQPAHLTTLQLKGQWFEQQYAGTNDLANLQKALKTYTLADSLIDKIRVSYKGSFSKNILAGNAKAIYARALDCAYLLWQQNHSRELLERLWYFSEKSRAIALLESLRESEAKQISALRKEDVFTETRLKRDINFYEKLIFDELGKSNPNTDRISGWNRKTGQLREAFDSLTQVFKLRYPEYYRFKYNKQLSKIEAIQRRLPSNTALIEYFWSDSSMFTFVVDQERCQVFRQAIDTTFQHNIATLRKLFYEFDPKARRSQQQNWTGFQQYTQSAYQLYKTLLAEPLQKITAKKLVIIPDETMGYIPVSALLQDTIGTTQQVNYRNLSYLVRDYVIRLEYSGTLFNGSSNRTFSSAYLGIAPSYSGAPLAFRSLPDSIRYTLAFNHSRGDDIPALRYNIEEVNITKRIFGGRASTGAAATEDFFMKNASRAGILHLPMHAFTNDVDPLYSMLVFSSVATDSTAENDGRLHAYELYDLKLNARLAVLSACHTGTGKMIKGEGIMSLARAFRFAGCPNVMMSLWSVNDLAGKEVVVDFFNKLHAGAGKATALHTAQIDFLKTVKSDELTHPYYWATFTMVGDDAPVQFGASARIGMWLLLGLVFGLLFLIFKEKKSPTRS